uniref:Uncharacterized protein n=1 Tax=viral metagenome TaxID=1070528 RepID=A0A6M3XPW0_9ZZZZ
MATFLAQVTALTGAPTSGTECSTWLTDGAADIIRRIKLIDPMQLFRFASTATVGTSGLAQNNVSLVLDVYRGTWESREIPAMIRHKAGDSASIYRATTQHPKHYFLNNTLKILPTPGATNAHASLVKVPAISSASSSSATFPDDMYYLIILYAAVQNLEAKMSDLVLPDDIGMPVIPQIGSFSDISVSLPTYTVVAPVVLPAVPADADIDFSGIGSTPVFVNPSTLVLPALDLGSDLSLSAFTQGTIAPTIPIINLSDGSIVSFIYPPTFIAPILTLTSAETLSSLILPVFPTIETFISVSETLPTYTTPPLLVLPIVPADANIDFSDIGSTPTFTNPSALVLPVLSLGADLSISVFTQSTTAPSVPVISLSGGAVADFGTAPAFTAPVISLTTAPTITDLTLTASAPSPPSDPTFTTPSISLISAPTYTKPVSILSVSTAMATLTTQIETNEDIELAQSKMQQVQTAISNYATDIQNELNKFNQEVETYQRNLQKDIESTRLVNDKESNEYASKLQKYGNQVNAYGTSVNAEVQTYIANEINKEIAIWQTQINSQLAEYNANIQVAIQEFNASNVEYQATIQEKIREAELLLTSDTEKARDDLQIYANQLQQYQIDVNTEFQEYLQKDVVAEITEWTTKEQI